MTLKTRIERAEAQVEAEREAAVEVLAQWVADNATPAELAACGRAVNLRAADLGEPQPNDREVLEAVMGRAPRELIDRCKAAYASDSGDDD
jgi:hypothetical protein